MDREQVLAVNDNLLDRSRFQTQVETRMAGFRS